MKDQIVNAVAYLNDELAVRLTEEALNTGTEACLVLDWINEGMNQVGRMYESGQYYIADLVMSGYLYRRVLSVPEIENSLSSAGSHGENTGSIVICTVEGDIHDIGKGIFSTLAKARGYEITDLGVSVPSAEILQAVTKFKPDILAMSGIITNSIKQMKEAVDLLTENNLRSSVKIILGGLLISQELCSYIGADFATRSADTGIAKCSEWTDGI